MPGGCCCLVSVISTPLYKRAVPTASRAGTRVTILGTYRINGVVVKQPHAASSFSSFSSLIIYIFLLFSFLSNIPSLMFASNNPFHFLSMSSVHKVRLILT